MDFPAVPPTPVEPAPGLLDALGITDAVAVLDNKQWFIVEVATAAEVETLTPDLRRLETIVDGASVTARSDRAGIDIVSRVFGPGVGVDEDAVTGSVHCALTPYWATSSDARAGGVPGLVARRHAALPPRRRPRVPRRARRHRAPRRARPLRPPPSTARSVAPRPVSGRFRNKRRVAQPDSDRESRLPSGSRQPHHATTARRPPHPVVVLVHHRANRSTGTPSAARSRAAAVDVVRRASPRSVPTGSRHVVDDGEPGLAPPARPPRSPKSSSCDPRQSERVAVEGPGACGIGDEEEPRRRVGLRARSRPTTRRRSGTRPSRGARAASRRCRPPAGCW